MPGSANFGWFFLVVLCGFSSGFMRFSSGFCCFSGEFWVIFGLTKKLFGIISVFSRQKRKSKDVEATIASIIAEVLGWGSGGEERMVFGERIWRFLGF